MNCSDCQELLSGFIDNELSAVDREGVMAHLSQCVNCESVYQDLSQIVCLSRNLPEISLESHIWDEIERKVSPQSLPDFWDLIWNYRLNLSIGLPQVLLTAIVIMGLGVAFIFAYRPYISSQNLLSSASSNRTVLATNALMNVMKPEEAEVQNSIDRLMRTVEQKRVRWDPSVQSIFQRNLGIVDRSIEETQQLVKSNPDDHIAYEMMLLAYKEKQRLLEQFANLQK